MSHDVRVEERRSGPEERRLHPDVQVRKGRGEQSADSTTPARSNDRLCRLLRINEGSMIISYCLIQFGQRFGETDPNRPAPDRSSYAAQSCGGPC